MEKTYQSYFNNAELLDFLKRYQEKYPRWFSYESIGKSILGKDIWLITLSDRTVKPPEQKPGFWVEANIHSSEVTGTQGALYLCEQLLEDLDSSGEDSPYFELLKKITYYILPRFTPDGADAFFKEKNSSRSTPIPRPWRFQESSFNRKDLDGDGEITLMRWKDPCGAFKELKGYPGVLVPRASFDFSLESKGEYYQVLPEGVFENFDGFSKTKNNDFGYDFNRQAPSYYSPEGVQKGAGELPLEFPETRAVAEAFRQRKNIFSSISYHTYGGFIIKPPSSIKNHELALEDFMVIEKMAELLKTSTQYSVHSGNDDFVYTPGKPLSGNFDEWYFLHQGVFGITVEYWDPWEKAGLSWQKAVEKYESISEENMIRLLAWAKEHLDEVDYFKVWTRYSHPQLGEVEIGGFKTSFFLTNPPIKFLANELEKVFQGTLQCSQMFPNVIIKSQEKTKLAEGLFRLELVVANTGYLPTYGSVQALDMKSIPRHPELNYNISGESQDFCWIKKVTSKDLNHLKGFSHGSPRISPFFGTVFSHEYEQKLEWIFQGEAQISLQIDYAKGGVLTVNF
ncbi:MAG: M14 family metallopeptidase [Bdellovibrionaceae bacterium]|nr:M14 family metallopeptidase [Pseudobdellovibrionaceae bacterium]NUM57980.1 hypothetical protein [Pseudobdellovibrionaceae bacterium]